MTTNEEHRYQEGRYEAPRRESVQSQEARHSVKVTGRDDEVARRKDPPRRSRTYGACEPSHVDSVYAHLSVMATGISGLAPQFSTSSFVQGMDCCLLVYASSLVYDRSVVILISSNLAYI
jgi:hypothetical protein